MLPSQLRNQRKVCPSFSDAAKRFILSHAEMKPKNILKSVLNPVVDKIS